MTVFGQQTPGTTAGDYNSVAFVVQQLLNKIQTVTLVRVVAVSNDDAVAAVGTVDVQPLVAQMTGDRVAIDHGVIYGIPYFRLQGGVNAVILDPKVGDIGMCAFASRDISAVVAAKGPAPPGSYRKFNWSDGLYLGGMLNGTPTRYVRFTDDGITLHAATVRIEGDLVVTGDVVAGGDAISLVDHVHDGVQSGGSDTGPPVP